MSPKHCCPDCGSEEFISQPNQYDILIFTDTGFEIQSTEQIDECQVFCRACSKEVDIEKSDKEIFMK